MLASSLQEQRSDAVLSAASLDQLSPGFANDLKRLRPDIVIHTAGPYQGQDYRVAATCLGIVKNWDRFIPSFQWLSGRLIALGQNHGPEIPCTPALILARKLAAGQIAARGAQACLGMITLFDFDAETSDLDIDWTVDEETDE